MGNGAVVPLRRDSKREEKNTNNPFTHKCPAPDCKVVGGTIYGRTSNSRFATCCRECEESWNKLPFEERERILSGENK